MNQPTKKKMFCPECGLTACSHFPRFYQEPQSYEITDVRMRNIGGNWQLVVERYLTKFQMFPNVVGETP